MNPSLGLMSYTNKVLKPTQRIGQTIIIDPESYNTLYLVIYITMNLVPDYG